MKIKHLKINGFGKIIQKEIKLNDGINIIYGENEAGKSSLLKFVACMFYGASKTKNGKAISDFEKYTPWKTEEYSGKIEYTLDNGESYEVFREFRKKNPIVYNSQKEDISRNFSEDKTRGLEFFEAQTGIDEETYFNTAISEQEGLRLSKSSQNGIVQKISNMVSTGDDNVSFQKSLAQITKAQNEKIGTDRTTLKPINIVNSNIKEFEKKLSEFERNRESSQDDENLLNDKKYKLKQEEKKLEFLKSAKILKDNRRLKYGELDYATSIENENNEKIKNLSRELASEKTNLRKKPKINLIPYIAISCILLIISIALIIAVSQKIFGILGFIFTVISIAFVFVKKYLAEKKYENQIIENIKEIERERDILLRANQDLKIEEKRNTLADEEEKLEQELLKENLGKYDVGFLQTTLRKQLDELVSEVEAKEYSISNLKLEIQKYEFLQKAQKEKLEELAKIQEEYKACVAEREELLSLNTSYNLAKECLEEAYENVKRNISPKFTENLCDTISNISNGKYTNISFSDEEGLVAELDNGSYVPVQRLSTGTIDQMYLSLRLSTLKEISKENMPIILDEAFAYFDNDRISNLLSYINSNYKDSQILIFTCSNREKDILDKLNIEYNLITLEK